MNAKLANSTGLLLAGILLLAVNIFSNAVFKSARLDLTENELFTLSEGTRSILSELDEPITLRLYLSQRLATRLPGIKSYAARVRELLEEYQLSGGGQLKVIHVDPEPFSEAEDRAVGYGVRGVPLDAGEEVFYFGLVGTSSTDEEEVIPFFSTSREQFLEYDITKLIYTLGQREQKVVGLLSTLPIDASDPQLGFGGMPGAPWMIIEQIRQLFEVRTLERDVTAVPDDIDVLMLVHPTGLSARTLYALDQFVLRGGRTLVFVDPYPEADRNAGRVGAPSDGSGFDSVLGAWGLALEPGKVVADLRHARRVQVQRQGRLAIIEYPIWMELPASLLNAEDIVTSNLDTLSFASAGSLNATGESDLEMVPLVESDSTAMLVDTSRLAFLADPEELVRSYRPGDERLVLAARVTGKVRSAFPDGPPPVETESGTQGESGPAAPEQADVEHLSAAVNVANVIVVADTDFLQDRSWVRVQSLLGSRIAIPTAANGTFVANALENLAGSGALISVRSRGTFTRPFDRIDEIRQAAELRFREKEQQLITGLEEAEKKLIELESMKQRGEALILSNAQQREIVRFRQEKIRIRGELREVRRELRKDIERLGGWMKFINIGLVPLLIGIGGLVAAAWKLRRQAWASGSPTPT